VLHITIYRTTLHSLLSWIQKSRPLSFIHWLLHYPPKSPKWSLLLRFSKDTNWLLRNMPYRGRNDWAVWPCAIAHTIPTLHCQLAPWKGNEALFVFYGQTVWNLLKSTEEWRFSMETVFWVRAVYEWVERFQNGRQKVSDKHWSGRPVSVTTERVKQQIEQWIQDYRRVTIDETAVEFNMSSCSTYNIVHDDLGYREVCSRWVPKELSDDQKRARQTICQEHLDHHAREGDAFLQQIWQETSHGYTIMNQRVTDNRCSGSTCCLWPT
jgi:AraC-like DNA-binding protein